MGNEKKHEPLCPHNPEMIRDGQIGECSCEEFVDVIASGYEWICPKCEVFNKEIDIGEEVICSECGEEFKTNPPEHCYHH